MCLKTKICLNGFCVLESNKTDSYLCFNASSIKYEFCLILVQVYCVSNQMNLNFNKVELNND